MRLPLLWAIGSVWYVPSQTVVIEVPFGYSVLHGTPPPQSGFGLLPAGREGRDGSRWMLEVTVQNALR